MRVLVTGAAGLIGAPTVRALSAAGIDVVTAGRGPANDIVTDLTGAGAADSMIAEARPDGVVHLAWPDDDRIHSLDALDWVGHTAALLRACVDHEVAHVVTAGTCFEYELGPDAALEAGVTPERPATIYGAAKLAVHDLLLGLVAAGRLRGAHARIFYVYGEGEESPRLVPAVGLALLRGEEVDTTDGSQRRDFLHVDDVGGAIAVLAGERAVGTYDIASGTAVPVAALVDGLEARIASGGVRRGALPRREGDAGVIVGSPASMARLGWHPAVGLEAGLDRTVEWLRAQHEEQHEGTE